MKPGGMPARGRPNDFLKRLDEDIKKRTHRANVEREEQLGAKTPPARVASESHIRRISEGLNNPDLARQEREKRNGFITSIPQKYKSGADLAHQREFRVNSIPKDEPRVESRTPKIQYFTTNPKRKMKDYEMDDLYRKMMQRQEYVELKIREARRDKLVNEEGEIQRIRALQDQGVIPETEVWKINDRFQYYQRVLEERGKIGALQKEAQIREQEKHMFRPNLKKSGVRTKTPDVFKRMEQDILKRKNHRAQNHQGVQSHTFQPNIGACPSQHSMPSHEVNFTNPHSH